MAVATRSAKDLIPVKKQYEPYRSNENVERHRQDAKGSMRILVSRSIYMLLYRQSIVLQLKTRPLVSGHRAMRRLPAQCNSQLRT